MGVLLPRSQTSLSLCVHVVPRASSPVARVSRSPLTKLQNEVPEEEAGPTLSLVRGTNPQFYCTGVIKIIYNKLDDYFFVSADRQTFLGFEMTANLHNTSTLCSILTSPVQIYVFQVFHFHIFTSWYDISKSQVVSISLNGFYSTPSDQHD